MVMATITRMAMGLLPSYGDPYEGKVVILTLLVQYQA